jgi:F-type H+-transporting ATPase subunit delta
VDIFIGQLVGFAVVVFVFIRYIKPPLSKSIAAQKETIATQVAESEQAKARLAEAKDAHATALEQARAEASQIREEARGDAQAIAEQMRNQADAEVKRITEHGRAQVIFNRQALIRQLRAELGLASLDIAGNLVREHLEDPQAKQDSFNRVIDELEQMAAEGGSTKETSTGDAIGTHSMRAASRDSVRTLARTFDEKTGSADAAVLRTIGDELGSVAVLLAANPVLRKHLAESTDQPEHKAALVDSILSGKVSDTTLDIVKSAVDARWSATGDFLIALERLARLALLTVADRGGKIGEVEDELFRLGRLLLAEPELSRLLSDANAPVDGRLGLLDTVLGGKVTDETDALVRQAVRLQRGHQPIDVTVSGIAELAAARRGESVAHVIAPALPSDAQIDRLSAVLGRIYGREMSVQIEIDEELLGGFKVIVADEVIEGDVASRLAKASETLPS